MRHTEGLIYSRQYYYNHIYLNVDSSDIHIPTMEH